MEFGLQRRLNRSAGRKHFRRLVPKTSFEDFYAHQLNALQDGAALLLPDGTIRRSNLMMNLLLSLNGAGSLARHNLRQFIAADYRENFDALLEIAARHKAQVGPVEVELASGSSERVYAQMSLAPLDMYGQAYVQVLMRDVSEWRLVQNELIQAQMDLERSYVDTLEAWARALELREHEHPSHSRQIVDTTVDLAQSVGFSLEEITHIRHGAILHDIGKIAIPDAILWKPGPLNSDEWAEMKRHPIYAYELLKHIDYLRPAICIPHSHHERWDGSGYPMGLQGEQIPLAARLFSVVDVYNALSEPRVYRPHAWPEERIFEYLQENSGTHFDPEAVKAFFRLKNA